LAQVELFLLTYGGSGRNEEAVRTTLLNRRSEWMASGFTEDHLTERMVGRAAPAFALAPAPRLWGCGGSSMAGAGPPLCHRMPPTACAHLRVGGLACGCRASCYG